MMQKPPGGQSRVERVERLYRGFIEVAVKPQKSDAINRGIVQRVFEPARKKADAVIYCRESLIRHRLLGWRGDSRSIDCPDCVDS